LRERGVIRSLIVGESFGPRPCRVEGEAALEAVIDLRLKRVIALIRSGGASVDDAPVGEEARVEGLIEGRDGRGEGKRVLIGGCKYLRLIRSTNSGSSSISFRRSISPLASDRDCPIPD
jgi:hypothetical protein